MLLAEYTGPLSGIINGVHQGHPLIWAALIIAAILVVTKWLRIDLTFLVPFIEVPIRWLLSAPADPMQTAVNVAISPLAAAIRALADKLDPPKPPAS